jgi:ABC-2 type transport system ATP-binding protein
MQFLLNSQSSSLTLNNTTLSISVKNITKLYGTQKALDEVSFEVGKGQIVGFLGPNGAGKSTMMKILTCYIPQTSGDATVCGFDVNEESMEVRKRIGYLPENNPLYHEMYVKEYLQFIAGIYQLKGNIRSRISKIVFNTGLEAEKKKKIGALSKGYRQRVGLAQALIHDPEVLILDEPTTGLDPNQLSEIRALIQSLGKEKTVLLSTHIMQEVEAITDRVIIINKGTIVADEKTSDLRKKPGQNEIVIIEFEKAVSQKDLLTVQGVETAKNVKGNTWKIISKDHTDIRAALFKWSVDNQHTIISLQKEEQKLEDIFHLLTGH